MRIAVGGFQHETNTFAPQPATLADFVAPDAWPGLTRGAELIDAVRGINLPAAGFIAEAQSSGDTIVPLTWCSATPSGRVTRDAFEHIAQLLIDDLRDLRHLDAVYLDLHGAMVADHVDDADGELLRRIRATVGPDIPVIASLDFHANVSSLMVGEASALVAYRTYPHVDMANTGSRALRCLHAIRGRGIANHLQQPPFLIPLTSQCTLVEPLASVFSEVAHRESGDIVSLNFTPGFPAADVAECGPAVFGYGLQRDAIAGHVNAIATEISARRAEFALDILPIDAALQELDQIPPQRGRPVVLADTQDNPGGGGTATTTSLLKALIAHRTPGVLAGVIFDPDAASRAHEAGIGASIEMEVGASFGSGEGVAGETPLRGRVRILSLGDGRFTATGPFYLGSRMNLGPMALLEFGGIHVAVASRKQQAADQAMFRHLGAEPADFAVLVLKSSVHFRADFGPIAHRVIVVEAPGPNIADPAKLAFTKGRGAAAAR